METLENLILQTLSEAGIDSPPVPLEVILGHLGLDDLFWDYSHPEEKGSSLFRDEKKNSWRIRLSPWLSRERLSFDLAHECVEFIALRAGLEAPHFKVNEGAAQLLMPALWVRKTMRETGFDLFAVKRTFSTASLDTCALRMVILSQRPCLLFTCQPLPAQDENGLPFLKTAGQLMISCRGASPGLKRRTANEKETSFLEEACLDFFPLVRNTDREVIKTYPVLDERRTRVKKVFMFSLPEGEEDVSKG